MSYAQALFEVTQERNLWDVVPQQLQQLMQALPAIGQLVAVFEQPGLSPADKTQRLQAVLGDMTHEVLFRLLDVMVQNNRIAKLPMVAAHYQQLVDKARRVLPATVTTVVPMTDDQKRRLVETLKHMTHMDDIRLTCAVDAGLLGGVMLKIQDLVVDGSTKGKLSQLRKQWC
jgi:F-type H+-transporting ATPase subunit delta